MDYQRKRTYGYRQEVLNGANCKVRILRMIDDQISSAVDRFLEEDYGAACFAEFAANRLGVEFDASDFNRSEFPQAEQTARDKASRMIPTQIQESLDENLSVDVDSSEWNWQAMAGAANSRWGLKLTDRQLKQTGRDNLMQFLTEQAEQALAKVDLTGGKEFLEPNWGLKSISDWVRLKFQVPVPPESLEGKGPEAIKEILRDRIRELYRQKEIEFPVKVGMARFMSDRPQHGGMGQRYDREGLYHWVHARFPGAADALSEEDFRTQPRSRLQALVLETSRRYYPRVSQTDIDRKLEETLEGTQRSEPEDARELAEWMRSELHLEVPEQALTGVTLEQAQQILWNAFDERYRPEMQGMERSLLLGRLDASWKNHLYTMDHLRSGIGLVSYGQIDPKTEYKRQGMKEFDAMWEGVQNKVTDSIFRMEEEEGFQESLWQIDATIHESAPRATAAAAAASRTAPKADGTTTNAAGGDKKPEPIRNRGTRVGRNEPCPCGSGKKYKNCHMRQG